MIKKVDQNVKKFRRVQGIEQPIEAARSQSSVDAEKEKAVFKSKAVFKDKGRKAELVFKDKGRKAELGRGLQGQGKRNCS